MTFTKRYLRTLQTNEITSGDWAAPDIAITEIHKNDIIIFPAIELHKRDESALNLSDTSSKISPRRILVAARCALKQPCRKVAAQHQLFLATPWLQNSVTLDQHFEPKKIGSLIA